ncbi:MAG: FeoB-associated Cys-rich membrane protein [Oscillospiraceae bacterium]|nr:FeoB-associated Cys-rich membrane protein [Oscillospiraceae bacterium]
MPEFIVNNIGTIVVGLLVLAVLALAAWKMISDKKQGRSSCGGGCSGCPNAGLCHAQHDEKTEKKC